MRLSDIKYVFEKLGCSGFTISGEWVMISCPLAKWTHKSGHDNHPSFGVKVTPGMSSVNCFGCGFTGGVLRLLNVYEGYALKDGTTTQDFMQELKDYVLLAEEESDMDVVKKVERPEMDTEFMMKFLYRPHEYFLNRGVYPETCLRYGLGYIENEVIEFAGNQLFRKRAMFPLFDQAGQTLALVGAIGRDITNQDEVKYKNLPLGLEKSKYLYGSWLKPETAEIIVLCEGPMDSIKLNQVLHKHGRTEFFAVSIMGGKPSKAQVDLAIGMGHEIVAMLDNDSTGKLGTKTMLELVKDRVPMSMVLYPDGVKDPDEAGDLVIDMLENRKTMLEMQLLKQLRLK